MSINLDSSCISKASIKAHLAFPTFVLSMKLASHNLLCRKLSRVAWYNGTGQYILELAVEEHAGRISTTPFSPSLDIRATSHHTEGLERARCRSSPRHFASPPCSTSGRNGRKSTGIPERTGGARPVGRSVLPASCHFICRSRGAARNPNS